MELIETLKENIKSLQDHYKKDLTPIKAITINNNNKKEYGRKENINEFWRTYDIKFSTKYLLDLINNNNVVGFGIAAGKRNNIIVIDWDNKETTNKEFINKLHDQKTLTISTPSGGFHFIFKYNELFKKNARGIFNNIDIRTNRGLIFHGIREDGIYNIYRNEPIKILNDNLIHELLKNIHQDNILKNVEDKEEKIKYSKDFNKKYDLSDIELKKLLDHLPNEYLTDFNDWIKITHILKEINKYDIWNEWSKNNKEKYNKEKNNIIWQNISKNNNYSNDLYYIIWLVKFHNKEIQIKQIERIYKEYEEITEENEKKAKYINREYLNIIDIDENKKLNILKSPTGSGKTTNTINYIKKERLNNPTIKIYSITHLITIADDHHKRFNKADIKIFHYKNTDLNFLDDDYINDYKYSGGVVVINSLTRLLNLDFSNSIIYLDEINAVIECLLNSSVIKNRREIINAFIDILNQSKFIIATDATITNLTYDFLKLVMNGEEKINFVINTYQNGNNIPCYFIEDYNKIEELLKEDLKNNENFMACFNSKRKTDDLNASILTINPEYKEKILKYTSTHGEKIEDVNEEWKGKISLFSPSIVQGIDYNPEIKINVYCFVYGDTTLNPVQVAQQIARNRNPKNIYIYIEGCENRLYYKGGLKQIQKEFNNIKNINDTIYKDLLDTRTEGIKTIKEENELTNLFYRYKLNEDILKSSFKYNLKKILHNKGCKITDDLIYTKIEKSKQEKKETRNKIKQLKEEEINIKFDDYINNRLTNENKYKNILDEKIKVLNLYVKNNNSFSRDEKELLRRYKEILNNETLFKSFINIIYYLCNNNKSNDKKIIKRNHEDYSHHTFKEIQSFVKTYKRLLITYTPKINPYNYSYNEIDYNEELINISDDDYNIIKALTKTTRQKPKTTTEFLRLIKQIAKKIFGDMIQQHNKTIRTEKGVKNCSLISFNEKAFYIALRHIKYYSNNTNLCPYIFSLIHCEEFNEIEFNNIYIDELLISDDERSIKSTDTEDNKSTTSENKKCLLPFENIDIDKLIKDVKQLKE